MASIIGKAVGAVASVVTELEQGRIFTSPLNKLWRAKILLNRATSPMPKDEAKSSYKTNDALNQHYARASSYSVAQKGSPWVTARKQVLSGLGEKDRYIQGTDYTQSNRNILQDKTNKVNQINNQIQIINKHTSPPTIITIQNRPNELNVNPQSAWVAVKSMGRNNPFMMYTGGEDTISFDVSWYVSDPNNRKEVITKCNLLKSWTKADGYVAAPPTLNILWGTSGLFDNDTFILESAPFVLTHFQNASRMLGRYNHTENGERVSSGEGEDNTLTDLHLYPNYATQTLTFKRVSATNQRRVEIVSPEDLAITRGIEAPAPLETFNA